MKDKRLLISSIILVATLIVGLIFVSYAYFSVKSETTNNLEVNVVLSYTPGYELNINGTTDINLSINGDEMLSTNAGNILSSDNANFNVTLTAKEATTCDYDIYWVWDDISDAYEKTADATNEFTYSLTSSDNTFTGQLNNSLSDIETSGCINSSCANYYVDGKIYKDTFIGSVSIQSENSVATSQNYISSLNFYNLDLVQDAHAGKTYRGSFEIKNIECYLTNETYNQTLVDKLLTTVEQSNPDSISAWKTTYPEDSDDYQPWFNFYPATDPYNGPISSGYNYLADFTASDIVPDVETYKYIGPDPDNYISFNGEVWRIIGIYTEDIYNGSSYETSANVVKIIRTEPLYKDIDYDEALLDTYLYENDHYSDNKYIVKVNLTSKKTDALDYPVNLYGSEISYGSTSSDSSSSISSQFQSYVFMPRISDYLLSTSGTNSGETTEECDDDGTCETLEVDNNSYFNCLGSNYSSMDTTSRNNCILGSWLSPSSDNSLTTSYWTSTVKYASSGSNEQVGAVLSTGAVFTDQTELNDLYPVVYLKTSLKYVDGDGTKDNPYIFKS